MTEYPYFRNYHIRFSLLIWLILSVFIPLVIFYITISASKTYFVKIHLPFKSYNKIPNYTHFNTSGKGAATIVFNNAWKSQYNYGYKYLKNKKIKAAISTSSNFPNYPNYWNWDQLKEAQNNKWEIISQGRNYLCNSKNLNDEKVFSEVKGSKEDFLKQTIYVSHFSSPCGEVNLRLTDQVSAYYNSQIIGEEGINNLPLSELYLLKEINITNKLTIKEISDQINKAKTNDAYIIFIFDRIEEKPSQQTSITPNKFKEIVDSISSSGLPLVVPSEIIE